MLEPIYKRRGVQPPPYAYASKKSLGCHTAKLMMNDAHITGTTGCWKVLLKG